MILRQVMNTIKKPLNQNKMEEKEFDEALDSEFGKAKVALREYLLENKEKVANDLDEMRIKSNQNKMKEEMDVLQPNLETKTMTEFKQYGRISISEMRPYVKGEILDGKVSISQADKDNGSPKVGDMIARNPKNHEDQWLVAKQYFEDNLEEI